MINQNIYLVCDSSGNTYEPPYGIYASCPLAIAAMKKHVAKGNVDYLHCYEVIVSNPISEWKQIVSYANGEWSL